MVNVYKFYHCSSVILINFPVLARNLTNEVAKQRVGLPFNHQRAITLSQLYLCSRPNPNLTSADEHLAFYHWLV